MSRAHELLPIPPRDLPVEPMPGLELRDEHRRELDIAERFVPARPARPTSASSSTSRRSAAPRPCPSCCRSTAAPSA
ncbi:MAG: hypothetical protein R3E53_00980 [Myxococcota bacterium]